MTAKPSRFSSLRWRLLAAFLAVAVGAVALLAALAIFSIDRGVTTLAAAQRAELRDQIAAALADAYRAGRGTWNATDLTGVSMLAQTRDTTVVVVDPTGQDVASYDPGHDTWEMHTDTGSHTGSSQDDDADTSHDGKIGTDPGAGTGSTHDGSTSDGSTHVDPQESTDDDHSGSRLGLVPAATYESLVLASGQDPANLGVGIADNGFADIGIAGNDDQGRGTEQVVVSIVVDGRQVGTA